MMAQLSLSTGDDLPAGPTDGVHYRAALTASAPCNSRHARLAMQ